MRYPLKLVVFTLFCLSCILQDRIFGEEHKVSIDRSKYILSTYTTEDGLPQNSATSVIQTKDGYMWVATFGGLSRFDGIKFTNFTTSNTPQLINNRLTALYEDRHGVLWIGSEDGDLMKLQDGVFSLVKRSEGMPKDGRIYSMWLSNDDILWYTSLGTLTGYNTKTQKFTVFNSNDILTTKLKPKETFATFNVAEDAQNNLWFTSTRGLLLYRDGKFTEMGVDDNFYSQIYTLALSKNGDLWFGSSKTVGLYKDGVFTQKIDITRKDKPTPNAPILNINKNNEMVFSVIYSNRITIYETAKDDVEETKIDYFSLSGVRTTFVDSENNIWIGFNHGLIKLKKRHVYPFAIMPREAESQAVIEDLNKTVWITNLNKLIRYQNGKFEIAATNIYDSFTGMAYDKNNVLWLGTHSGIAKFENDKLTYYQDTISSDPATTSMYFDSKETLWIGMRNAGLREFKDGNFKTYTTENGLINNSVLKTFEDKNGALWIGTKGGLSKFENGQFTNFATEDGLTNNQVREIYQDEDGTMWFGTYGGGILRYKDGKFIPITSQNGLAEDIVSRILPDDKGNFWILGNQGVYTINRNILNDFADGKLKRVFSRVFNTKDGMRTSEGNGGHQPAGWRDSEGNFWFPMIHGGVVIDPHEVDFETSPVYIEKIFLNKTQVSGKDKLELSPDFSNLEIEYTAVCFDKPDQVQFRYKLEGYDTDWQDVGTRRIAYYSYLPPGKYKFIVSATNGNNIWSEQEATLEITVRAFFWQTWWFSAIIALALTLLVISIYQIRVSQLKKYRLEQEEFSRQLINAHESERNRIAGELHDSLGQNLLVIKNWTLLLLKQFSQDTKYKKQLEDILEASTLSLEETRTISRNLRPQNLKRFGLTETIKQMIKQVSESSGISFQTEIENIDGLFDAEEEISIYRIFQECFNNIVKHSKAQNAVVKIIRLTGKIEFTNSEDKVLIKISDDGKGFNSQTKEKSGFGLDNIEQRVQLLGGKYSIKSSEKEGTKIKISLNIE